MAEPILEFGGKVGLAYKHDWNAAFGMRQQQAESQRRQQADAAAKVKMMADDLKFANVNNEYDAGELKNYSIETVKKIGEHILSNPNWQTDPMAYMQYKQMTNELQNNDIIRRATRFDAEAKALQDFIAKNPEMKDDPDIQSYFTQVENYRKYGNTDGEQYTQPVYDEAGNMVKGPEKLIKEFTFMGIDNFNYEGELAKIAGTVGSNDITKDIKGTKIQEVQVTREDAMEAMSTALKSNNRFKWEKLWKDENPELKELLINQYGNEEMAKMNYLTDKLLPFTDYKYSKDDNWGLKAQLAMQAKKGENEGGVYPYFTNILSKQPLSTINGKELSVFNNLPKGQNGQYTVMPNQKGFIQVTMPDGQKKLYPITTPATTKSIPILRFNDQGFKGPDGKLYLGYSATAEIEPSIRKSFLDALGFQNMQQYQQAFGVKSIVEAEELMKQQFLSGNAVVYFQGNETNNSVMSYEKQFIGQKAAITTPQYGLPDTEIIIESNAGNQNNGKQSSEKNKQNSPSIYTPNYINNQGNQEDLTQ